MDSFRAIGGAFASCCALLYPGSAAFKAQQIDTHIEAQTCVGHFLAPSRVVFTQDSQASVGSKPDAEAKKAAKAAEKAAKEAAKAERVSSTCRGGEGWNAAGVPRVVCVGSSPGHHGRHLRAAG